MPRQTIANTAAIATGHPLGADAGIEVFRDGGNAIDAAVAAMIALSVVIPGSVGLGGYGGSAVVYAPRFRSEPIAVDFDSCAPLEFREGLVTGAAETNYYGARSVTVPAVVAGLDHILRKFGKKSWLEVSQPAIRLADEGFEFDSEHKRYLDRCAPKFDRQSLANLFGDGALPNVGDSWRQPELAKLLRRLADDGPQSFYDGDIAHSIVSFLRERGGILTMEDFQTYRPQVVEPLCASINSGSGQGRLQFYTPPPPSGGVTSLAILQTVERFDPGRMAPWGAPYFHVLAEAIKHCWRERQEHLGDPAFIDIPLDRLLSDIAADVRAEQIRTGEILRDKLTVDPSAHTANVVAADADGNVISLTATQGWMYGSHLVVDGMGLVLNHGMSRFDYIPGHPNAPAAGKRMQHNMAPMIALSEFSSPHPGGTTGGACPAFAFGLPGGPKIVSATAQLAINAISFGATPAESVAAPRLHTDGGEPLLMSEHTPAHIVAQLTDLGHQVRYESDMGGPVNVLAIDVTTRKIHAASGEGTGAVAGI
jgi:gamma-glutamyltranspeptidase / glutathione hydrolase